MKHNDLGSFSGERERPPNKEIKWNFTNLHCFEYFSLICITSNFFTIILLCQFSPHRNKITRPNQAGFWPGMICDDQLFTLKEILFNRAKHQQLIIGVIIDFVMAFDSVLKYGDWLVSTEDNVRSKLIRLKAYYDATPA